jgi:hypothetical protein
MLVRAHTRETRTRDGRTICDREGDVANCAVTEYACDPTAATDDARMRLVRYNFVAPLHEGGATVTSAKDLSYAPR